MLDIEKMSAREIEEMMDALKREYTKRRGEFRKNFVFDEIEEWIDEAQNQGEFTITFVGKPSKVIPVKKWQLVMCDW